MNYNTTFNAEIAESAENQNVREFRELCVDRRDLQRV